MGIQRSIEFVGLFLFIQIYVWGYSGMEIHLLGRPIDEYTLIWSWIFMIAAICGTNYGVHEGKKHPIGHVISSWWVINILWITILQNSSSRGLEQEGELILGLIPSLALDFIIGGIVDFCALLVIWTLVKKGYLVASGLLVGFGAYLVANLVGYYIGAYGLLAKDANIAKFYDSYIYLTFTIMLALQLMGSVWDGFLRWSGSNVDFYTDIRPYFRRFTSRYLGHT